MPGSYETDAPILERSLRRPFGDTGLSVSPLGFGGAPIGNMETDQDRVTAILNTLLDHGVNLIDTAHVYFGSEEAIGAAIGHRRDEYVLVSKCGSKYSDDDLGPTWSPEYIRRTIDRSLQRLRTDRIDVMLLHTCDLDTLKQGDALATVLEARDAGKVRFAGYSGDNETGRWAAQLGDIRVIQTSISICDQRNIDVVLPVTRERSLGVQAKRPLANAAWKTLAGQYERYRKYAGPYHERFDAIGFGLQAIRDACGEPLEWPEIALRFTQSIDGVHTAIAGTTNPASVAANLRATARGPLPPAAVELIRSVWQAAEPEDTWPGLT